VSETGLQGHTIPPRAEEKEGMAAILLLLPGAGTVNSDRLLGLIVSHVNMMRRENFSYTVQGLLRIPSNGTS